ncbi:MAG: polyphenol oxidase family protein [Candidatus Daviesbacteria bacterium]|nr:polyphenol oxidase family protein [Candidatus Daviesbacteria bacterium]
MILSQFPEILVATSTKDDGNMSLVKGDPKQALKNRKQFLKQLGVSLDEIVSMQAVHGTDLLFVRKNEKGRGSKSNSNAPEIDGLITKESGVYLFLLTADCLPVALFDPQKQVIGLIHAGRAGLVKGILSSTISKFIKDFKSDPKDILVYIAPSIGPCCYGPADPQNSPEVLKKYIRENNGQLTIDLWQLTQDQLVETGVLPENIENSKICSYHNDYFSNRKFKAENLEDDFRFATVLGLKP